MKDLNSQKIRVDCMYCERTYKPGSTRRGISHGICPECRKKPPEELDAIAERKARERARNHLPGLGNSI